ncbi:MAG: peptidylprolyl isomerase [Victivallales bacterium]|nr:peptidylprolyl isomerase [Victivallales bacterium]
MRVRVDKKIFGNDFCMIMLQDISQQFPGISDEEARTKVAEEIIRGCLLSNAAKKEMPPPPKNLIERELPGFKAMLPSARGFLRACAAESDMRDESAARRLLEDKLRVDMLVQRRFSNFPEPSREMIEELFEKHMKGRMKPAEAHASHIVKRPSPGDAGKTFLKMCEIRKEILDGLDFAEAAKLYSECKESGGDIGWFSKGMMVEEFETVVLSMNTGEVSPVFRTPFGYHIAKLHDKRPPSPCTVDNCMDEIVASIKSKLVEDKIGNWLKNTRAKAAVEVDRIRHKE